MKLVNLLRKREYLDWNAYAEKIDFLDNFYWQQRTRKQSVQNIHANWALS